MKTKIEFERENQNLHPPIGLYSFPVVLEPYNDVCSVLMYSLAIDTDQLLVNLYRFHCYRLPNPFGDVSFGHIEYELCENHKCRYVVPGRNILLKN